MTNTRDKILINENNLTWWDCVKKNNSSHESILVMLIAAPVIVWDVVLWLKWNSYAEGTAKLFLLLTVALNTALLVCVCAECICVPACFFASTCIHNGRIKESYLNYGDKRTEIAEYLIVNKLTDKYPEITEMLLSGTEPDGETTWDGSTQEIKRKFVKAGLFLERLENDENDYVREEVAKKGYDIEHFNNDQDECCRLEVVKRGLHLKEHINDKSEKVRLVVAQHGYGLNVLAFDTDEQVAKEAKRQLGLANASFNTDIAHWMQNNPEKVA
jgi:hypothetical protein